MKSRLLVWLPPLLWMALILWFSTTDWSAQRTGGLLKPWLVWLFPGATAADLARLHGLSRAAAHLGAYAILAVLWLRALKTATALAPVAALALALAMSVIWAAVDEAHQATVPTRTGSAIDVALDAVGASLALAVAAAGSRRWTDRIATIALWCAALAGALALTISFGSPPPPSS